MLILAATPIGNLGDCSVRLGKALAEADSVFAEDTRHAKKLLNHLGIRQRVRAYHDHSPPHVLSLVEKLLQEGKTLVYISDAGTPILNDPGFELVRLALDLGVLVDHLPGPCAPINALVLSGIPANEFCFLGFFPSKPSKRQELLTRLPNLAMTTLFFEAPSRISHTLEFLECHFPSTHMALCRELTKLHQEVLRGKPGEIRKALTHLKGEMVLVLEKVEQITLPSTLEDRAQALQLEGKKPNQIAKILAGEFNLSKREVYQRLLRE